MRFSLLLLVLLPIFAVAETAYVTDTLRLGLHQAADTSDRAFRNLESGQEVEIVSRNRNYASVRLPDGAQGHVKAAYLVFEKPAKLIVAEVQAAQEKLQQELTDTRAAFASPAATIATLEKQVAEKDATLQSNASSIATLTSEVSGFQDQFGTYKYSLPFTWVGGAMFVCLIAGFVSGLWWIDYRSRKRHGGVRIF
jgi:SH3 domain protein